MACSPIAEGATSYFFNSYSQSLVLHCGANGIGTPNLLPVNRRAQRQVLALQVCKRLFQGFWNRKGDRYRIARGGLDARYRQLVK